MAGRFSEQTQVEWFLLLVTISKASYSDEAASFEAHMVSHLSSFKLNGLL